jgi:hypothetical protein
LGTLLASTTFNELSTGFSVERRLFLKKANRCFCILFLLARARAIMVGELIGGKQGKRTQPVLVCMWPGIEMMMGVAPNIYQSDFEGESGNGSSNGAKKDGKPGIS